MLKTKSHYGTGPGGVGRTNGLSSLKLWLQADVDVTTQGDHVVQWQDQSGCGNHALQVTTAAQPTYIANHPHFLGKPAIRFNGQGQFLRVNHQPSLNFDTAFTLFMVIQPTNLEKNRGLLSKSQVCGDETNYALAINAYRQRLSFQHHDRTWWRYTSESKVSTTRPMIVAFTFDKRFQWGAFGLNGQLAGEFKDRMRLIPNQHSLDIGVHNRCQHEGDWLVGDLAELILYDGPVNTVQRIIIENYLSAKYGIDLPRTSKGKDIYRGDDPQHGSFTFNVAGIGFEKDGPHKEAHSAGLTIIDKSFLKNRGDYFMVGHKSPTNAVVTNETSETVRGRWERVWFFDISDMGTQGGEVRLIFRHQSSELDTPLIRHVLLERKDEYSPFRQVTQVEGSSEQDGTVRFTVATTQLVSGRQYTLGHIVSQPLFQKVTAKVFDVLQGISTQMQQDVNQTLRQRHAMAQPKPTALTAVTKPLLEAGRPITANEIQQALAQIQAIIEQRLGRDVSAKVEDIQQVIGKTLTYINDINSSDPTVYVVRHTALEYLPETLENYLNLPPDFANHEPLKDGKTAHQLLLEQLELLKQEMRSIANDFHRQDARKLLAHGQFLRQKFGNNDLLLD